MVSIANDGRFYIGKSTDKKPVSDKKYLVMNGSAFYEIDTQDLYMFDADTNTWIKQS